MRHRSAVSHPGFRKTCETLIKVRNTLSVSLSRADQTLNPWLCRHSTPFLHRCRDGAWLVLQDRLPDHHRAQIHSIRGVRCRLRSVPWRDVHQSPVGSEEVRSQFSSRREGQHSEFTFDWFHREMSNSKSPVFSGLASYIEGAVSIRAYGFVLSPDRGYMPLISI